MHRTLGNQANSAKHLILLSPIPHELWDLADKERWKPIKDEIRSLACNHGLTHIPDQSFKVETGFSHELLSAMCEFNERSDALAIFGLLQGHLFKGMAMQAWLFQPGQKGHETVDGPRDPTRNIVLPPIPIPPPFADPSVTWPRGSRGPFRRRSKKTEHPIHNMVVDWTKRSTRVSQDSVHLPSIPATGIPMRKSGNNVDAVIGPYLSLHSPNLDLHQQRPGQSSASVSDASEMSDLSKTPRNTPELSSSSRNSSISAVPDTYLPGMNSSYGTFHFFPRSPHQTHISSGSSSTNVYTPASSRNQSGSSHILQDRTEDETCKVIILNVGAGETDEDINDLLEEKMPYMQHETPKRGGKNKWSVNFSKMENAEKAKERLDGGYFKERKLQVHLSKGGRQREINSGASTTSTTSSTSTRGPTIIDGSVTG